MSRIMALDVGTKRIGVAVSDEMCMFAQGRCFIERSGDKKAVENICAEAKKEDVKEIVVGLPVNMDGTYGERADDSRRFAEKVKISSGLPVLLWDERLSTREAENIMLEADLSRKKRKKVIDQAAAQIILQGYLDGGRNGGEYV